MTKQSLKQAIFLATSGKSRALRSAALTLDGVPASDQVLVEQALRRVRDELPNRQLREYTVEEFRAAMYHVGSDDVYRTALTDAQRFGT